MASTVNHRSGAKSQDNSLELLVNNWGYRILLWGLSLAPIIAFPLINWPIVSIKNFWLLIIIVAAIILWLVGQLQSNKVVIPQTKILLSAGVVALVAIVSALVSGTIRQSLIGNQFDFNTAISLVAFLIAVFLVSIFFQATDRINNFFTWLLGAGTVAAGYYLLMFIGRGGLNWEFLSPWPANIIGGWLEIGVFFGLIALIAIINLEWPFETTKPLAKISITALILSIIMMALINFYWSWLAVGFLALGIFVYGLTAGPNRHLVGLKRIVRPSSAMVMIALIFILASSPGSWLNQGLGWTYNQLGLDFVDIRPGWSDTLTVARHTLQERLLLGTGPNQFELAFNQYQPESARLGILGQFNFSQGFGWLITWPITTGLLGLLALGWFLASSWFWAGRGIMTQITAKPPAIRMALLIVSSLVYLWLIALVYPLGPAMIALAFAMIGLMIAWLVGLKLIPLKTITISKNPRVYFGVMLVLGIGLMASLAWGYLISQAIWAQIAWQRGLTVLNTTQDLDQADRWLVRAVTTNRWQANYHRGLAELRLLRFNQLLGQINLPDQVLEEEFQTNFVAGLDSARLATQLAPNNYRHFLTLGRFYDALIVLEVEGASDLAHQAYVQARNLSPFNPDVLAALAQTKTAVGDLGAARYYLELALDYRPDFLTGWLLLAQIDWHQQERDSAIARTKTATKLAPNDFQTWLQLGVLQYLLADYQSAKEALIQAKELSPNQINANAQYFLGLSYDRLGQTDEALKQFKALLELSPDHSELSTIVINLEAGRPALAGITDNDEFIEAVLGPAN